MIFDELINIPMPEDQLMRAVTQELQRRYLGFQNCFFFIRLGKCENNCSQILWQKVFNSKDALENFYFDTEYERSVFVIGFNEGRYVLDGFGFSFNGCFEVWPDRIDEKMLYEASYSREEELMMSREEVNGYLKQFADLAPKLRKKSA
jgi:hypothetical protein